MTQKLKALAAGAVALIAAVFMSSSAWAKAGDPLTFTALEPGSTISLRTYRSASPKLETSLNDGEWLPYTSMDVITLARKGDKVAFRAAQDNSKMRLTSSQDHFTMTGKIAASGDVTTMLVPSGTDTFGVGYVMQSMFRNCTALVTPPELPAVNLTSNCYAGMFSNCTSLVSVPLLPAKKLPASCYKWMFMDCSSITEVEELSATEVAESCCRMMFSGCTSLTDVPDLMPVSLSSQCYYAMFSNCTSLVMAPDLPATNLFPSCYHFMFGHCTSLEIPPDLPAKELKNFCYESMFRDCTKLATPPVMLAEVGKQSGCHAMFSNCTSLVSAPDIRIKELWAQDVWDMFTGCTNLTSLSCAVTNALYKIETLSWLENVAPKGAIECPDELWEQLEKDSGNGVPPGWARAVARVGSMVYGTIDEAIAALGEGEPVESVEALDPKAPCPEGYAIQDGVVIDLSRMVATIGERYFPTYEAALARVAEDGGKTLCLSDIKVRGRPDPADAPAGYNFVMNGTGLELKRKEIIVNGVAIKNTSEDFAVTTGCAQWHYDAGFNKICLDSPGSAYIICGYVGSGIDVDCGKAAVVVLDSWVAQRNPRRIAPYFQEIQYDYWNRDAGVGVLRALPADYPSGGCTACWNGRYAGRNLDWKWDDAVTFLLRMPATPDRHASIGIAHGSSDDSNDAYTRARMLEWLPGATYDGINDAGVYINVNMVAAGETNHARTTGTNPGAERLNVEYVPRFVLDRADSPAHAVELLRERDIYAVGANEFHWLIASSNEAYIVECVDNELVVLKAKNREAAIANFHVSNSPHLGEYDVVLNRAKTGSKYFPWAIGIERYGRAKEGLTAVSSRFEMLGHMTNNWFAAGVFGEANIASDFKDWWTENNGYESGITDRMQKRAIGKWVFPGFADHIWSIDDRWEDRNDRTKTGCLLKKCFESMCTEWSEAQERYAKTGSRRDENGEFIDLWQTSHTCAYDLERKSLSVMVQENFEPYYVDFESSYGEVVKPVAVFDESPYESIAAAIDAALAAGRTFFDIEVLDGTAKCPDGYVIEGGKLLGRITGVSVAQDGELYYTGKGQTPKVTATAKTVDGCKYTFYYAVTEGGDFSTALPSTYTTAGRHELWYYVSAPNHVTTAKAMTAITVLPPACTIDGKPYDTVADAVKAVEASKGKLTLADITDIAEGAELPDTVYLEEGTLYYKPVATITAAQQRWPWNGKVDVAVKAEKLAAEKSYALKLKLVDGKTVYTYTTEFAGLTGVTATNLAVVVDTDSATGWDKKPSAKEYTNPTLVPVLTVKAAPEIETDDYVQLWADGPYWAKCNLGASKPEEYGYYYWWGDTVGYKRNAAGNGWEAVSGGASISFSSDNCPTYNKDNATLQSEGYIDSQGNLVAAYDAVTVALGAPWRMPTDAEIQALVDNCDCAWTNINGVVGYMVTGKTEGYTDKSIFLPAAGYGNKSGLLYDGSYGLCWSSTPYSDDSGSAWYLFFYSGYFNLGNVGSRSYGQPVRPIRGFAEDDDGAAASAAEYAGEAVAITLDTRAEKTLVKTAEGLPPAKLTYSETAWGETEKAKVNIQLDGADLDGTYKGGFKSYTPAGLGSHVFTHNPGKLTATLMWIEETGILVDGQDIGVALQGAGWKYDGNRLTISKSGVAIAKPEEMSADDFAAFLDEKFVSDPAVNFYLVQKEDGAVSAAYAAKIGDQGYTTVEEALRVVAKDGEKKFHLEDIRVINDPAHPFNLLGYRLDMTDDGIVLERAMTLVNGTAIMNLDRDYSVKTGGAQWHYVASEKKLYLDSEGAAYIVYGYVGSGIKVDCGKAAVAVLDTWVARNSPRQIAPYFQEIQYGYWNKQLGADILKALPAEYPAGGCTACWNGRYVGRNMDWKWDDAVTYLIRMPATDGRHASIGIAHGTSDDLDDTYPRTRLWEWLPSQTLDGINDAGVYINVNMVAAGKVNHAYTTGTNPGSPILNVSYVPRFILDNADSPKHAIELLRNRSIYSVGANEFHWIIADKSEAYIVECVDNELVVIRAKNREAAIANFHVSNSPHLGEYEVVLNEAKTGKDFFPWAMGIERYDRAKAGLAGISSRTGMLHHMTNNWVAAGVFGEAAAASDFKDWWSENNGYPSGITDDMQELYFGEVLFPGFEKHMWSIADRWEDRNDRTKTGCLLKAMFNFSCLEWAEAQERYAKTGSRKGEDGKYIDLWQTVHTCAYDLEKKSLAVMVQENFEPYYADFDSVYGETVKAVAEVAGTPYETLEDAFAAVEEDETLSYGDIELVDPANTVLPEGYISQNGRIIRLADQIALIDGVYYDNLDDAAAAAKARGARALVETEDNWFTAGGSLDEALAAAIPGGRIVQVGTCSYAGKLDLRGCRFSKMLAAEIEFSSRLEIDDSVGGAVFEGTLSGQGEQSELVIKGGSFRFDPTEYVPGETGYAVAEGKDETGRLWTVRYNAAVGDLKEQLGDKGDVVFTPGLGDEPDQITIKLTDDVEELELEAEDTEISVDLNGHSVTADPDSDEGYALAIAEGTKVTIKDTAGGGSVTGEKTVGEKGFDEVVYPASIVVAGDLVIEDGIYDGAVDVDENGSLEIKGGKYRNTNLELWNVDRAMAGNEFQGNVVLAPGKDWQQGADGYWTLVTVNVFELDGVECTLEDVLAKLATETSTGSEAKPVKLLRNLRLDEPLKVDPTSMFFLDLNGFTLSCADEVAVVDPGSFFLYDSVGGGTLDGLVDATKGYFAFRGGRFLDTVEGSSWDCAFAKRAVRDNEGYWMLADPVDPKKAAKDPYERIEDALIPLPEYYGPFVPGVKVAFTNEDLIGCSVSGLSFGLRFDKKTGAFSGAATKPGVYKVAFSRSVRDEKTKRSVSHKATATFLVDSLRKVTVSVAGAGTGRATPAETMSAVGKKVSLRATADKGCVFGGWYVKGVCVSQEAIYRYTVGEEPEQLVLAQFIKAGQDTAALLRVGEVIGDGTSKMLDLEAVQHVYVGVPVVYDLKVKANSATTVQVTTLPGGLSYKKSEGVISGVPKQAKQVTTVIKVTNASKIAAQYGVAFDVMALPDWAVGSFDGAYIVSTVTPDEYNSIVGTANFTVTRTGSVSGKVFKDGKTYSFSAKSFDGYDAATKSFFVTVTPKAGKAELGTFSLEISATDEGVGRAFATAATDGIVGVRSELHFAQNIWKRTDAIKYEVPSFPSGKNQLVLELSNGLTAKIGAKGTVVLSGRLTGDNGKPVSVSATSQILSCLYDPVTGVNAQFVVYVAPKKNFAAGLCELVPLRLAVNDDNVVTGVEEYFAVQLTEDKLTAILADPASIVNVSEKDVVRFLNTFDDGERAAGDVAFLVWDPVEKAFYKYFLGYWGADQALKEGLLPRDVRIALMMGAVYYRPAE